MRGVSRASGPITTHSVTGGNSYSHFASHFAANATGTLRNDTNDLLGGADRLAPAFGTVGDAGGSHCASRQLPRAPFFSAVAFRQPNALSGASEFTVGFPIENGKFPQKK